MIWNDDISFEGFSKKINDWYDGKDFELCDPPIEAQYALDLIFKTLIDDKEHYEYLTTMPESTKQTALSLIWFWENIVGNIESIWERLRNVIRSVNKKSVSSAF